MELSKLTKPYGFKQITTCLMSFVENIEKDLHEILPDLPVFVLWTGDNNIYMDTKFQTVTNEIYEKNPRFVIRFNSFSEDSDQRTQKYNRYQFKPIDESIEGIYECNFRRLLLWVECDCSFVSSNMIDALSYMEIMYGIITKEHSFTYEYQGSTFQSAYSVDSDTELQFPESDSGTRNFIQKIPIRIQVHLYVPIPKTIKRYKPVDKTIIETTVESEKDKIEIPPIREEINIEYTKI